MAKLNDAALVPCTFGSDLRRLRRVAAVTEDGRGVVWDEPHSYNHVDNVLTEGKPGDWPIVGSFQKSRWWGWLIGYNFVSN